MTLFFTLFYGMEILETGQLSSTDQERICELWNHEFPKKMGTTIQGFTTYLQQSTRHRHYLLMDEARMIQGWAHTFDREGERWFSILIANEIHGQGWGTKLMNRLKADEEHLCGWVADRDGDVLRNGMPYRSPVPFYLRNGFTLLPEVRFPGTLLSAIKIIWNKTV